MGLNPALCLHAKINALIKPLCNLNMFAQSLSKLSKPGLYLLTPNGISDDPRGLDKIHSLLTASDCVTLLQYRDKLANHKTKFNFASKLQAICKTTNVPLVINDDVQLALRVKAAGVHLGKNDMPPEQARDILGRQAIIGASCYQQLERAEQAVMAGADYLAFGSMFASKTKPTATRCSLSVLQQAKAKFRQPLVAIGGLTTENINPVLSAGADWAAVISDVFTAENSALVLNKYQDIFTTFNIGHGSIST